jgi:hypothetical protein
MGCNLPFHEIFLFTLLGLGVILYRIWQRSRPAPDQRERKPATRATPRSKAKPPLVGLTTKSHCEAYEHAREPAAPPSPPPPPLLASKRGRPRELDVHTHYCPTKTCPYYGWTGRGISAPMVIQGVALGDSCTVSCVRPTFWRPTGPSSMAKPTSPTGSCGW